MRNAHAEDRRILRTGIHKSIDELKRDLLRDHKDSTGKQPLQKAADAEEIDTTNMTLESQIEYIVIKPSIDSGKSAVTDNNRLSFRARIALKIQDQNRQINLNLNPNL